MRVVPTIPYLRTVAYLRTCDVSHQKVLAYLRTFEVSYRTPPAHQLFPTNRAFRAYEATDHVLVVQLTSTRPQHRNTNLPKYERNINILHQDWQHIFFWIGGDFERWFCQWILIHFRTVDMW